MGGPFSQITRSYFRVPNTYASSVLPESLAQAHYLLIYLCFFFFIYFSYNFSFLFLIAMECRPRKWRDSFLLAEVSQDKAKIPRRERPLLAGKRDSGAICFFFRARFSEKLQRNCTSKCYCKKQIDNNFRSVLLSIIEMTSKCSKFCSETTRLRIVNPLEFTCSVIVSTHGFKKELCHTCSVLVSTYGLKNELCYSCSVVVFTHGMTRLSEISSESMCFQWIRWTPSEDFPTPLKVLFTFPVSSYDWEFR